MAALTLIGVLAVTLFLASAQIAVIGLILLTILILAFLDGIPGGRVLRLIARLKWFYLSLLVFYGMWPSQAGSVGSGLTEAGSRILALMLVVALVVWMTERIPRELLARTIGRLSGRAGERFARRMLAALALFESRREAIEARRAALSGSWRQRLGALREWLIDALDQALSGQHSEPEIPDGMSGGRTETRVETVGVSRMSLAVLWMAVAGAGYLWWWTPF